MSTRRQVPCCLPMPSAHIPNLPSHNLRRKGGGLALAVNSDWYWGTGTTLNVRLLNRNEELEPLVEEAAKVWEKYANIKFVFQGPENSEIRIRFDPGLEGGSSHVGKPKKTPKSFETPTMFLGTQLEKDDFRRTVLHELGHALGCVHEHCSPMANIDWNESVVIQWYAQQHKDYTEEWVNDNVFKRYDGSSYEATLFDQSSIMIYPILAGWAKNIVHIGYPKGLSDGDKMLIRRMYRPIMRELALADYCTEEDIDWLKAKGRNVKVIQNAQQREANFTIGLTKFDLEGKESMQLRAYQTYTTLPEKPSDNKTTLQLHLDSDDGTTQWSAAAHLIVSEKHDYTIQTGSYITNPSDMLDKRGNDYKFRVDFERPFEAPPNVIVWIQAFHFDKGNGYGLTTNSQNVSLHGFDLCINNIGRAKLRSAEVSWIANEIDPPGIYCGRLEFPRLWSEDEDKPLEERGSTQTVNVNQWQVDTVHTGISKFDFDTSKNIRLNTEVTTNMGNFEVTATTWHDSECRGVIVSYLAVCH